MRSIALGGLAAAIVLGVAGCAGAGPAAPAAPVPTGPEVQAQLAELPAPAPESPVLAIATVLEQDDGALLCLGAVAESAPPQCDGPRLLGWDWAAFEHSESGGVRWAQGVAIEGTYDPAARTFTQTGEPMSVAAITMPAIEVPEGTLDDDTIEAMQGDFSAVERADVLGTSGEQGTLVVEVVYDDGTVQAAIDEIYGPGVAFVISALRGDAALPTILEPPMDTAAPVITGETQARLAALPTPSATEPVLAIGTVLDNGTPMLCSNVATSLPPQCGGPEVLGWVWSSVQHEEMNGVRWTDAVAMTVTYDAAAHAVTVVEMLDLAALTMPARESVSGDLDAATQQAVQDELFSLQRPDVLGGGGGNGIAEIEVVYDDGSIQAALDEIYGPGVVHVWSWLR
ncbi:hypothetical protein [Agrococcus sp. ProA11]|uniref:hypothetical protein n=1 Tax=Agrococcus chionoecetis TaxID=3153752 RepID=UPI00326096C7